MNKLGRIKRHAPAVPWLRALIIRFIDGKNIACKAVLCGEIRRRALSLLLDQLYGCNRILPLSDVLCRQIRLLFLHIAALISPHLIICRLTAGSGKIISARNTALINDNPSVRLLYRFDRFGRFCHIVIDLIAAAVVHIRIIFLIGRI